MGSVDQGAVQPGKQRKAEEEGHAGGMVDRRQRRDAPAGVRRARAAHPLDL
jgi:hypothetical protein